MPYLSQMLGRPVIDCEGELVGNISDLAVSVGEVFPRITSVAFKGLAKTPLMISWRKYVASYADDEVRLSISTQDIRFSYLQNDEILLSRDLMNKQIVDTQGMKVVRVNDLKLSYDNNQLRLLGAEVGARGLMRGLSPAFETLALKLNKNLPERIIAWNYIDLLDKDLSQVKLSMDHKRLHELHPADVADILEQLDPQQRANVFAHLDNAQAAEAITEMEGELQSDVIDDLGDARASKLLAQMDPDDAADIIGDLPYEKAETLLRLMGVKEEKAIRKLLGFKEKTAGGVMTTQFFAVPEPTTVAETIERLRRLPEDHETVHYVYTLDEERKLSGVLSMRTLVLARDDALAGDLAYKELITVSPEEDQEEVVALISKYNILAMPVVDEDGKILGIVTVDDALDVMEEEHDEDLALAGVGLSDEESGPLSEFFKWFGRRETWLGLWLLAAIVISATGQLGSLAAMLLLMPFVLVLANDVSGFAMTSLIEFEDNEEGGFRRLVGRNIGMGLIAVAVLGAALLIFVAMAGSDALSQQLVALIRSSILPAVLAAGLTVLFTAGLCLFAKRLYKKGIVFPGYRASVITMAFALAAQVIISLIVLF